MNRISTYFNNTEGEDDINRIKLKIKNYGRDSVYKDKDIKNYEEMLKTEKSEMEDQDEVREVSKK